ncbi:MAG: hypothetical protein ABEJ46_00625 [Gemmatimonadota bacterium]
MNEARDRGSEAGNGEAPSVGGVAAKLALYVLPGAVSAMVVWEVFSELLSGRLPGGGIVWLAVALLAVWIGVVIALRRHVASRE